MDEIQTAKLLNLKMDSDIGMGEIMEGDTLFDENLAPSLMKSFLVRDF